MKKRLFILFIAAITLLSACAGRPVPEPSGLPGEGDYPQVEAGISEINKYGNIILTIGPESMEKLGYEPADIISVRIGEAEITMPIGTGYSDVDPGDPVCCFKTDPKGASEAVLAINSGDLATSMGIARRRVTGNDPGYEWVYAEGLDENATVYITMAEKQGYASMYALHNTGRTRSNERGDYADLSDAEYANFRFVETTGMGRGTLFRSSSPVNAYLNRNEEADAALLDSLVKTVMNMSDSEDVMKSYPGYGLTNYSKLDIIALDMSLDFFTDEFREKLAEGFRYLSSRDGPYLIHCIEGKDRTGFACAVLECLMGASADEVVEDYMRSYYNYYYIAPGTERYDSIASGYIGEPLARAFGIGSIRQPEVDLQARAEAYLKDIGLKDTEISALKDNLSKDYGGLG